MDILDHSLDTSGEGEEVLDIDSKSILAQELTIVDEGSLGSGSDDQKVHAHLSPQIQLESTPENEVQYSIRSSDGTITYRVLQVDEGMDTMPSIVSSSTFPNSGVQQVLTSQLNGQLYVIGNPGEVFNQSPRTIAPRATLLDTTSAVTSNIKKRDERRRATHNEVERRRRDKINNWIMKLSKIIPESSSDISKGGSGAFEGQSKGGILAKACEYILELRESNHRLGQCLKENEQLTHDFDLLKQKNEQLEKDNSILRNLLSQNGIEIAADSLS